MIAVFNIVTGWMGRDENISQLGKTIVHGFADDEKTNNSTTVRANPLAVRRRAPRILLYCYGRIRD
jgi:hypothetical protein